MIKRTIFVSVKQQIMYKEALWKAISEQVEDLKNSDKNLTHVQIEYQLRDVEENKNTAIIKIKLK